MAEAVAKCPACGAFRESFTALCPDCGYEFTDIQTSLSIQKFADQITEYDKMIYAEGGEKKKGVGFWTVLGWIFLFPVMLILFILKKIKSKHTELTGAEKLKSEAILNFPIPNSRNDLIEFSLFVNNKIKPINYFNALTNSGMNIQKWNNVWKEKGKTIEQKAGLALKDDRNSYNQIAANLQKMNDQISKNDQIQWIMIGALGALFLIWIIAI